MLPHSQRAWLAAQKGLLQFTIAALVLKLQNIFAMGGGTKGGVKGVK